MGQRPHQRQHGPVPAHEAVRAEVGGRSASASGPHPNLTRSASAATTRTVRPANKPADESLGRRTIDDEPPLVDVKCELLWRISPFPVPRQRGLASSTKRSVILLRRRLRVDAAAAQSAGQDGTNEPGARPRRRGVNDPQSPRCPRRAAPARTARNREGDKRPFPPNSSQTRRRSPLISIVVGAARPSTSHSAIASAGHLPTARSRRFSTSHELGIQTDGERVEEMQPRPGRRHVDLYGVPGSDRGTVSATSPIPRSPAKWLRVPAGNTASGRLRSSAMLAATLTVPSPPATPSTTARSAAACSAAPTSSPLSQTTTSAAGRSSMSRARNAAASSFGPDPGFTTTTSPARQEARALPRMVRSRRPRAPVARARMRRTSSAQPAPSRIPAATSLG